MINIYMIDVYNYEFDFTCFNSHASQLQRDKSSYADYELPLVSEDPALAPSITATKQSLHILWSMFSNVQRVF